MSVRLLNCVLYLATLVTENVSQVPVAIPVEKSIKFKYPINGTNPDSGLYNEDLFEGDIVIPRGYDAENVAKNAITDRRQLWPSAAIVYRTTDDIGCPDSHNCAIVMKAMHNYHLKTCIRFKEWTGERDYIEILVNRNREACWSSVGRRGGVQQVSLGSTCFFVGVVMHELGHAIGFWHEMNRPDRDQWITVIWRNIKPGMEYNFKIGSPGSIDTLGERFDYRSIMMYGETAFSKDGVSPTIVTKTGEYIGPLFKKPDLSASDVRRVYKLYQCFGNTPKLGFPYDIICDFNRHVCGFKNVGKIAWMWTMGNGNGFLYTSYGNSGVTPGYLVSVNLHGVHPGRGNQGCLRFWYMIQSNGRASLTILQAVLDDVTQTTYNLDKALNLWKSNNVNNKWTQLAVPMFITKPFKLIFYSQFSYGGTYGLISLDGLDISYSPCARRSLSLHTSPSK